MNNKNVLTRISDENNGVLTVKKASVNGISRPIFQKYVSENGYEKVSKGVYLSPDMFADELYLLQLRCPSLIYSHGTALYLLNMTDRDPLIYKATAKTGYNPSYLKHEKVKIYTVKSDLYDLGVTFRDTEFGNKVRCYGPERTVCDLLRSRSTCDPQLVKDGIKNYINRPDRNISLLLEFSERFHINKLMRHYLEVLL